MRNLLLWQTANLFCRDSIRNSVVLILRQNFASHEITGLTKGTRGHNSFCLAVGDSWQTHQPIFGSRMDLERFGSAAPLAHSFRHCFGISAMA
jgi:hypothetical protein